PEARSEGASGLFCWNRRDPARNPLNPFDLQRILALFIRYLICALPAPVAKLYQQQQRRNSRE
ncbi:hypothetical protein, partial [Klebsiella pneumoniae]|uniref:hypothetical protein n=2 Tax=Gammaproteobacteria TaxID=1236 RepID=UPI000A230A13